MEYRVYTGLSRKIEFVSNLTHALTNLVWSKEPRREFKIFSYGHKSLPVYGYRRNYTQSLTSNSRSVR